MNPEPVLELLKSGLIALTGVISTLAPQVWDIYLRQQIILGVSSLLTNLLIVLSCGVYAMKALPKAWHRLTDIDDEDFLGIVGMLTGALSLIAAIVFFFILTGNLQNDLGHILNPAYYAIQDLIKTIKP